MSETKSLAIYFSDEEPMGYPLDKEIYWSSYSTLTEKLAENKIETVIVRGNSYLGKAEFLRAWKIKDHRVQEISGPVKVDLVFNRDDKDTIPNITDCPIINDPEMDQICLDKIATAKLFPKMSPKTTIIRSFKDLTSKIKSLNIAADQMIVLKKIYGTEGRGIHILKAREVGQNLYKDWSDILMQEFIDSSIGIRGVVQGRHDLRVTVVNGKVINAFIRKPAKGGYLANISLGGTGHEIPMGKISNTVLDKIQKIKTKFKKYKPYVVAADFMNSPKGYKLVELNSRPGLQHPDYSKTYYKFNNAVAEMLIKHIHSL